jgi:hypothetical protein
MVPSRGTCWYGMAVVYHLRPPWLIASTTVERAQRDFGSTIVVSTVEFVVTMRDARIKGEDRGKKMVGLRT